LVPTKKDKERYLTRFLDIFKKLEITMPFGEALQQMSLYSKFFKDMLHGRISTFTVKTSLWKETAML